MLFSAHQQARNRLKIPWRDGDGLAIFMKRLVQGTFQRPHGKAEESTAQQ
jgi:transposase